jgi:hypothetical protein
MIDTIREHSATDEQRRDGEMVLRWAAAGSESARNKFRRLRASANSPNSSQPLPRRSSRQLAARRATTS